MFNYKSKGLHWQFPSPYPREAEEELRAGSKLLEEKKKKKETNQKLQETLWEMEDVWV